MLWSQNCYLCLTELVLSGQEITAGNVEKILSSVGVEADKEKLKLVVAACKGKTMEQLMAEGTPKLAAMGR